MARKIKILGICGSLRTGSFNRSILDFTATVTPENSEVEIVEIGGLPIFNQNLEANLPNEVVKFKEKIKASDAILFVTPEHNRSIPAALKNAIDWGSRPYSDNSWAQKPVAIMGASGGNLGTALAQYHLIQIITYLKMKLVTQEVMIGKVMEKLDKNGNLVDQDTIDHIKKLLATLVDSTSR